MVIPKINSAAAAIAVAAILAATVAAAATPAAAAATSGPYFLQNVANGPLNLDAAGHAPMPGDVILAYQPNGGDNQKWLLDKLGNGSVYIRDLQSDGLCATVMGRVVLQPCDGRPAQHWLPIVGPNQTFEFRNAPTQQCIEVKGVNKPVGLGRCDPNNTFENWSVQDASQ